MALELASAFQVRPAEGDRPGAFASFPYDRDLVRRFRDAFPRARWREEEHCWFVPGTTALRRLDTWMTRELETLDRHADERGRDAFAFEPLESPYLAVGDELVVRTPYSRTVVEAMRRIPWARWDPQGKVWRVPFRSYGELRARWQEIEEAARRNEPAARRARAESREEREAALALQAERRRHRYPVPGDDLPPLDRPVATLAWGIVVFEDIGPEPLSDLRLRDRYPHLKDPLGRYVFARWRRPTLQEVYRARPAREPDDADLRADRGWWLPDRGELREAARRLRQAERAAAVRSSLR
ncbi:hypothetical protein [Microvirga thermotolerans]|uniref:HARP domain-containing protein n=1 Tax=Microvirga thermotolerans TaxID=2651334 RepID=A0A5P9JUS6_9HYPH|nr:hypothetical protein [Microvirga thermotolerans]QFU15528.1 hypothetical protein GDR74_04485 [Microvirga thermotolerans]